MAQTQTSMRWASALSLKTSLDEALRDCAAAAHNGLDGEPDLAVLFLSPHFAQDFAQAPKLLARHLKPGRIFGCSAGGVIAGGREIEERPAVGLMAARLPGVATIPFHLEMESLPDMDAPPKAWAQALGIAERQGTPHFLLLGDPFSFNPEDLIRGLDYAFPKSVKVGGLASGARRPGGNALYLDGETHRSGLTGMALIGDLTIDPIVAQGCRPIGPQYKITGCEGNQLLELDRKPALEALARMLDELSEEDRTLARTSLFAGLLTTPLQQETPKRDFLIRNLVGLDPDRGVLAIGAMLRPGQTLQFHLRDKRTSAEDLDLRLRRYAELKSAPPPAGALLFSCLGRGVSLYGVPNHDSDAFVKSVGDVPLGGFFCNGEIGPVDASTYLHGYTSCFAIFRPQKS